MPNQTLQFFIVFLVINVMMSSIRSLSCFNVDVPGGNNNKKQVLGEFICLLTWPISKREDNVQQIDRYSKMIPPYPIPVTREERIRII